MSQNLPELNQAQSLSQLKIRTSTDYPDKAFSQIQKRNIQFHAEEAELSKYVFKKQNLFKSTNDLLSLRDSKKLSLNPQVLTNADSIIQAEKQQSGRIWKKNSNVITELKNRKLLPINLDNGYFSSYFIKYDRVIFPITVQIFTGTEEFDENQKEGKQDYTKFDSQIEIAIGDSKPPDHNNNIKIVFGSKFVIDQFFLDNYIFSTNNKIYITVFSHGKVNGHIGVLFKGV